MKTNYKCGSNGSVRGQGIGEGLMREAIRIAGNGQLAVMSLEVRVTNIVAKNLYRKLGFKMEVFAKDYYTDNQRML